MVFVEKLMLLEGEVSKMNKKQNRLMIDVRMTRKELERVTVELKENFVLTERLRKAAKARKCGGEGQGRSRER